MGMNQPAPATVTAAEKPETADLILDGLPSELGPGENQCGSRVNRQVGGERPDHPKRRQTPASIDGSAGEIEKRILRHESVRKLKDRLKPRRGCGRHQESASQHRRSE